MVSCQNNKKKLNKKATEVAIYFSKEPIAKRFQIVFKAKTNAIIHINTLIAFLGTFMFIPFDFTKTTAIKIALRIIEKLSNLNIAT